MVIIFVYLTSVGIITNQFPGMYTLLLAQAVCMYSYTQLTYKMFNMLAYSRETTQPEQEKILYNYADHPLAMYYW